jgi:hypothetical protein
MAIVKSAILDFKIYLERQAESRKGLAKLAKFWSAEEMERVALGGLRR